MENSDSNNSENKMKSENNEVSVSRIGPAGWSLFLAWRNARRGPTRATPNVETIAKDALFTIAGSST